MAFILNGQLLTPKAPRNAVGVGVICNHSVVFLYLHLFTAPI